MGELAGRESRTAVLLAAGGAEWEAETVAVLTASPQVVLLRRCLDLTEALAAATTGAADVAVLATTLPGLDADAVSQFGRHGVGVVAVGPEDAVVLERLSRIGVTRTVAADRAGAELADAIRLAKSVPRAAVSSDPTGRAEGPTTPIAGAPDHEPDQRDLGPDADSSVEGSSGAGRAGLGRIVTVWGPHGGSGRTTIAVGIAAELAARGHRVLLLDCDPGGGAVGQHLAVLDETSGLLAAARAANAGRLDRARLASYARQVGPGLRVLTGLPRHDRWGDVRPTAFDQILLQARQLDEVIVVDAGSGLDRDTADPFAPAVTRDAMTTAAVEGADLLVVVGGADPVGLTRLARSLLDLGDLAESAPLRVVVNRMRRGLGWERADLVDLVRRTAPRAEVGFLPEDGAAADRAVVTGRSLVESGQSALRSGLRELVDALEPDLGLRSVRTRGRGSRLAGRLRRRSKTEGSTTEGSQPQEVLAEGNRPGAGQTVSSR